jgi:hypothetical protein
MITICRILLLDALMTLEYTIHTTLLQHVFALYIAKHRIILIFTRGREKSRRLGDVGRVLAVLRTHPLLEQYTSSNTQDYFTVGAHDVNQENVFKSLLKNWYPTEE